MNLCKQWSYSHAGTFWEVLGDRTARNKGLPNKKTSHLTEELGKLGELGETTMI
ncbi:MAG: hypothetical protein F6K31_13520 [Symploca sp. SIO2G7]|nr:hypothetical protein [Symploca sp. SIO2G7]